jgi:hypothetical protein
MISRCPSCGTPGPDEERVCPSCGWDFIAHKRVPLPGAAAPAEPPKPKSPPPPAASTLPPSPSPFSPPAGGGFALPPARNLYDAPVPIPGIKPLPKLEPRAPHVPGENENPFTLRTPAAPPPAKTGPAEPPAKAAPPAREVPAAKTTPPKDDPAPLPHEPARKEGLSLPPVKPPETMKRAGAPREPDVPPRPEIPVRPKEPAKPATRLLPSADEVLDLDSSLEETAEAPVHAPPPEAEFNREPPIEDDSAVLEPEPDEPPPLAAVKSRVPAPRPRAPVPVPQPEAEAEPEPAPEPEPEETRPAPKPSRPEKAAARPAPATDGKSGESPARNSPVYIAAVAGAALGTVSVFAVYLLLRPDTTTSARASGGSPFAHTTPAPAAPSLAMPPAAGAAPAMPTAAPAQSPAPALEAPKAAPAAPAAVAAPAAAPAPAPAAVESSRPGASFAILPHVVIAGEKPAAQQASAPAEPADEEPVAAKVMKKPRPVAAEAPRKPRKPKAPAGPSWNFEGIVFDLLSARGVFAARLTFMDADGNVVGETETGPGGRYKADLPVGPTSGYTLKIVHADYTSRYIDEGDATSSLREATAEERQILMQAAARNLPWVGTPNKTQHRDLALVPKSPEEP